MAERLRDSARWSSPIMRHAIRLAVAIPVAWLVGIAILQDHQYWLPLTVAWVTRPEYGGTVGKVASRVLGTIVGLVVVAIVIYPLQPNQVWLVVICGIAAFGLFMAFPVNYAAAVVCVTVLVVSLLELVGGTLFTSVINRGAATVLAGILVIAVARVGPVLAAPGLARQLADLADSIRAYADATLRAGVDPRAASEPVDIARQAATGAVAAALMEPRKGGLDPGVAEKVLDAMLVSIFAIAAVDAGSKTPVASAAVDQSALDLDLRALAARLRLRSGATDVVVCQPCNDPPPLDPVRAPIRRAWDYLAIEPGGASQSWGPDSDPSA